MDVSDPLKFSVTLSRIIVTSGLPKENETMAKGCFE